MLVEDRELTARAAKIDTLLDHVESIPDPAMRATVTEIVQGLLLLYGEGLARIVATVKEQSDPATGAEILAACAADELISHLLLLHDLHPDDVETRVARALDEVRPYLQSHGGNVELIGVAGGVARLRLQGSCQGCPSSTVTLQTAIEEAIRKAAPDLDGIDAEGIAAPAPATPATPAGFIPLSTLRRPERAKVETPSNGHRPGERRSDG